MNFLGRFGLATVLLFMAEALEIAEKHEGYVLIGLALILFGGKGEGNK